MEIKRIHQGLPNNAWNQFVLETSNGFTNTRLDRIDKSIRVYVWCILGAQSNSKSRISKDDVASATKSQFSILLEQCINREEDINTDLRTMKKP